MNDKNKTPRIGKMILQILLGLTCLSGGLLKLIQPLEQLAEHWPWVLDHPFLLRVTAAIDLLIGLGLLLPVIFNRLRKLSLFSVYSFLALMLAACVFHLSRGEAGAIGFNVILLVLGSFVAWHSSRS